MDSRKVVPYSALGIHKMDGLRRLVILVTVSLLGEHSCTAGTPLDPFPLGTIGCLVSDVCDIGEICTNDLLFGSCQSKFSRILNRGNKYELGTSQIEELENQIRRLIKAGFTWKDAYAQCTLQNTIVEFSNGRSFNIFLCEDALGVGSPDWTDDANSEIADVLLQLLNYGEIDLSNDDTPPSSLRLSGTDMNIFNPNKRDEIVQVHKYFDKSKGLFKRNPIFDSSRSSYRMMYPKERLTDPSLDSSSDIPRTLDDNNDDNENMNGDDNGMAYPPLKEAPGSDQEPKIDLDQIWQNDDLGRYIIDIYKAGKYDGTSGIEAAMGADEPATNFDDDSLSVDEMIERLILSDQDQVALEGVVKGTLSTESLGPVQKERLHLFIHTLIQLLMAENDELNMDDTPFMDQPLARGSSDLSNVPEDVVFPDVVTNVLPLQGEVGAEEAESNYNVDDLNLETNEGRDESSILRAALLNSELPLDKKTASEEVEGEEEAAASEGKQPVDIHTIYFQVSKNVDDADAYEFVQNVTRILGLPEGMLVYKLTFSDRLIIIRFNDDPNGKWNAIKVAKEAENVNDKLEEETGITITNAGVGEPMAYFQKGDRLEVKQNNRYVVLTFILVGTIAGVVLAVVTIYLIKRHHRFKQKLAQLASNPDGNEASKDYQDLCRQRMQGKSSEKPEPLHAASRIGSVSESQVRSPSSRSSTSSWSEEPAATNMDISTGHIVLSYMEDHLKNQDRLDKEWEAVSSYLADPSSTKVANDPSNMRKNRFADIIPYDHSRVVLSSNANVTNTDFINANFITDHDPRNPAYICTQGPLPHTVADFWQMIWEQGSVVIVMLTKLTENGTSLCHRYWPEEGSDLYHIYEVHLVSEHIWCDDYLVRSFYLKNLQTNETRTVTQFHFLTWPQLSVPASIKALLDFRRKVNKSFRGRSCPIVVHCSDGCGRSGTYCLIDMVLNKMAKGAKEIDMAATLEHIRDQRMSMVKTKEQFQFSLAAVAEEVHAILKALPQ